MIRVERLLFAASVTLVASTAHAQSSTTETAPTPAPMSILAARPDSSPEVDAFYAARNGLPIWTKDETSRTAVSAFASVLRNSLIEGLTDPGTLASRVEAASAANDDKAISAIWVRYVQALKAPVRGMNYGDQALALKAPTAAAILGQASGAPSLADHVRQTSAVNPFYSALLEAAAKQGASADTHVRATLDRLRAIPAQGRAILVDVANAQLMLLEDGRVIDTMKVIVGKPSAPTPLLAGTIHFVTFNPYWHIPEDVAQRSVAPLVVKRGVSYLKAARYETINEFGQNMTPIDPVSVDWKAVAGGSAKVYIRQLSGPNNMMGAMKFGFTNDFGIYLHDTPRKALFDKAKRNLSLGCVRVERPKHLAQWLLGRDPVPPNEDVEQHVQVDKGVPIYITYLTARPDGDKIAYAEDVYGWDKPGTVPVAQVAGGVGDADTQ